MSDRFWWLPFGRVPEMDAAELKQLIDRGAGLQLIDVRSVGEYAAGHIDGTINLPINQLRAALPALALDPKRPVIAICATAHRSPPAVRVLKRSGFEAKQLRSGMLSWYRAKLPTVK
ncbi:MAG TPA: rhodanese-like domain-containing protein [Anaerolineae bacterium]|nr:rhodanese-like domain-containing protein [Anaerolineae bacterium]